MAKQPAKAPAKPEAKKAAPAKKTPVIKKTERKKSEPIFKPRTQQVLPKIRKGTTHTGQRAAEIVVRPSMRSVKEDCDRAVVAWGRMNPPTIGHEYLAETVAEISEEQNGYPMLFLSPTMNAKNPLSLNERVNLTEAAFGDMVHIQNEPDVTNTLAMLKKVNETFNNIVVVTGNEHQADYMRMFLAYNGEEFQFNEMEVVVLQRDERSDDLTEAVSATMLREAAVEGNLQMFAAGLPTALQENADEVMRQVQWGLGLQEAVQNPAIRAIVEYRNKNI